MSVLHWTYIIVGLTFSLYIYIAIRSRAASTGEFYVAGKGVPAIANGAATAADWMSAASFLGMAGILSFSGYDGSVYLMGWTGGYVLLALLLAPYLRKFGKFTVPDFVGDRYYSNAARIVAVLCALFVSFTYVCGQMRGVGIVFSNFLEIEIEWGVVIGMVIVLIYAVLGGMKGITYTQVAQYCVLIFAYLVPAIFISLMLTGNPVPQMGFGSEVSGEDGVYLLDKLDGLQASLGFHEYTSGSKDTIDVFFITMALMVGTAGLPHVIVRFYTVKTVKKARVSALWALLFIALLYTAAPAVSVFARTNLLSTIPETSYEKAPDWFKKWETTKLIAWIDKNGDGKIQYVGKDGKEVDALVGKKPVYPEDVDGEPVRGPLGQRMLENKPTDNDNELYVDRDIMVLANPEIANLPNWVVALVAAGGLAAALSTAAGLLLVISTSFAHDLVKKTLKPDITEKQELLYARCAAAGAVIIAGVFGIYPPDYVAAIVAFAFGLAASSFFPVIILGIFTKRTTKEGAIAGMLVGITFTSAYILYFKFPALMNAIGIDSLPNKSENWLLGISPEGIGTLGMILNFVVAITVSAFTPPPPKEVRDLVESIRQPED